MRDSNKQKTVFIIVSRGIIARNILRSGVLEYLKKAGLKIIVFFPAKRNKEIPKNLIDEFCDEQVVLEDLLIFKGEDFKEKALLKLYKLFLQFVSMFVYTRSTWRYSRIGNAQKKNRKIYKAYVERCFYSILSKFHILKKIARYIEEKLPVYKNYKEYFDKYTPDFVFTTSIVGFMDVYFMKEARRRGIKTVSMPKGWDNITKTLYTFVPDICIVQNEIMKNDASLVQKIDRDQIQVCGFPQFDWYRKRDIIMSREEYFSKIGLDPERRLIFFGSEGAWAPCDSSVAEFLSKKIKEPNVFEKKCSLLIRPHFSDVRKKRFNHLASENVKVDDNFTLSSYFGDNWNPTVEETKLFVNSIYHCDIMVTVASTLVLDACCFNKPAIAVAYGVLFDKKGKDISEWLYEADHYQSVLDTGSVDLARSEKELIESINKYLLNSKEKEKERKVLLEELCYKVDGESSKRIANVIINNI